MSKPKCEQDLEGSPPTPYGEVTSETRSSTSQHMLPSGSTDRSNRSIPEVQSSETSNTFEVFEEEEEEGKRQQSVSKNASFAGGGNVHIRNRNRIYDSENSDRAEDEANDVDNLSDFDDNETGGSPEKKVRKRGSRGRGGKARRRRRAILRLARATAAAAATGEHENEMEDENSDDVDQGRLESSWLGHRELVIDYESSSPKQNVALEASQPPNDSLNVDSQPLYMLLQNQQNLSPTFQLQTLVPVSLREMATSSSRISHLSVNSCDASSSGYHPTQHYLESKTSDEIQSPNNYSSSSQGCVSTSPPAKNLNLPSPRNHFIATHVLSTSPGVPSPLGTALNERRITKQTNSSQASNLRDKRHHHLLQASLQSKIHAGIISPPQNRVILSTPLVTPTSTEFPLCEGMSSASTNMIDDEGRNVDPLLNSSHTKLKSHVSLGSISSSCLAISPTLPISNNSETPATNHSIISHTHVDEAISDTEISGVSSLHTSHDDVHENGETKEKHRHTVSATTDLTGCSIFEHRPEGGIDDDARSEETKGSVEANDSSSDVTSVVGACLGDNKDDSFFMSAKATSEEIISTNLAKLELETGLTSQNANSALSPVSVRSMPSAKSSKDTDGMINMKSTEFDAEVLFYHPQWEGSWISQIATQTTSDILSYVMPTGEARRARRQALDAVKSMVLTAYRQIANAHGVVLPQKFESVRIGTVPSRPRSHSQTQQLARQQQLMLQQQIHQQLNQTLTVKQEAISSVASSQSSTLGQSLDSPHFSPKDTSIADQSPSSPIAQQIVSTISPNVVSATVSGLSPGQPPSPNPSSMYPSSRFAPSISTTGSITSYSSNDLSPLILPASHPCVYGVGSSSMGTFVPGADIDLGTVPPIGVSDKKWFTLLLGAFQQQANSSNDPSYPRTVLDAMIVQRQSGEEKPRDLSQNRLDISSSEVAAEVESGEIVAPLPLRLRWNFSDLAVDVLSSSEAGRGLGAFYSAIAFDIGRKELLRQSFTLMKAWATFEAGVHKPSSDKHPITITPILSSSSASAAASAGAAAKALAVSLGANFQNTATDAVISASTGGNAGQIPVEATKLLDVDIGHSSTATTQNISESIPSPALDVLVFFIINRYHGSIRSIFELFCYFMEFYSQFDFLKNTITIAGPIQNSEVKRLTPSSKLASMPVAAPEAPLYSAEALDRRLEKLLQAEAALVAQAQQFSSKTAESTHNPDIEAFLRPLTLPAPILPTAPPPQVFQLSCMNVMHPLLVTVNLAAGVESRIVERFMNTVRSTWIDLKDRLFSCIPKVLSLNPTHSHPIVSSNTSIGQSNVFHGVQSSHLSTPHSVPISASISGSSPSLSPPSPERERSSRPKSRSRGGASLRGGSHGSSPVCLTATAASMTSSALGGHQHLQLQFSLQAQQPESPIANCNQSLQLYGGSNSALSLTGQKVKDIIRSSFPNIIHKFSNPYQAAPHSHAPLPPPYPSLPQHQTLIHQAHQRSPVEHQRSTSPSTSHSNRVLTPLRGPSHSTSNPLTPSTLGAKVLPQSASSSQSVSGSIANLATTPTSRRTSSHNSDSSVGVMPIIPQPQLSSIQLNVMRVNHRSPIDTIPSPSSSPSIASHSTTPAHAPQVSAAQIVHPVMLGQTSQIYPYIQSVSPHVTKSFVPQEQISQPISPSTMNPTATPVGGNHQGAWSLIAVPVVTPGLNGQPDNMGYMLVPNITGQVAPQFLFPNSSGPNSGQPTVLAQNAGHDVHHVAPGYIYNSHATEHLPHLLQMPYPHHQVYQTSHGQQMDVASIGTAPTVGTPGQISRVSYPGNSAATTIITAPSIPSPQIALSLTNSRGSVAHDSMRSHAENTGGFTAYTKRSNSNEWPNPHIQNNIQDSNAAHAKKKKADQASFDVHDIALQSIQKEHIQRTRSSKEHYQEVSDLTRQNTRAELDFPSDSTSINFTISSEEVTEETSWNNCLRATMRRASGDVLPSMSYTGADPNKLHFAALASAIPGYASLASKTGQKEFHDDGSGTPTAQKARPRHSRQHSRQLFVPVNPETNALPKQSETAKQNSTSPSSNNMLQVGSSPPKHLESLVDINERLIRAASVERVADGSQANSSPSIVPKIIVGPIQHELQNDDGSLSGEGAREKSSTPIASLLSSSSDIDMHIESPTLTTARDMSIASSDSDPVERGTIKQGDIIASCSCMMNNDHPKPGVAYSVSIRVLDRRSRKCLKSTRCSCGLTLEPVLKEDVSLMRAIHTAIDSLDTAVGDVVKFSESAVQGTCTFLCVVPRTDRALVIGNPLPLSPLLSGLGEDSSHQLTSGRNLCESSVLESSTSSHPLYTKLDCEVSDRGSRISSQIMSKRTDETREDRVDVSDNGRSQIEVSLYGSVAADGGVIGQRIDPNQDPRTSIDSTPVISTPSPALSYGSRELFGLRRNREDARSENGYSVPAAAAASSNKSNKEMSHHLTTRHHRDSTDEETDYSALSPKNYDTKSSNNRKGRKKAEVHSYSYSHSPVVTSKNRKGVRILVTQPGVRIGSAVFGPPLANNEDDLEAFTVLDEKNDSGQVNEEYAGYNTGQNAGKKSSDEGSDENKHVKSTRNSTQIEESPNTEEQNEQGKYRGSQGKTHQKIHVSHSAISRRNRDLSLPSHSAEELTKLKEEESSLEFQIQRLQQKLTKVSTQRQQLYQAKHTGESSQITTNARLSDRQTSPRPQQTDQQFAQFNQKSHQQRHVPSTQNHHKNSSKNQQRLASPGTQNVSTLNNAPNSWQTTPSIQNYQNIQPLVNIPQAQLNQSTMTTQSAIDEASLFPQQAHPQILLHTAQFQTSTQSISSIQSSNAMHQSLKISQPHVMPTQGWMRPQVVSWEQMLAVPHVHAQQPPASQTLVFPHSAIHPFPPNAHQMPQMMLVPHSVPLQLISTTGGGTSSQSASTTLQSQSNAMVQVLQTPQIHATVSTPLSTSYTLTSTPPHSVNAQLVGANHHQLAPAANINAAVSQGEKPNEYPYDKHRY